MSEKGIGKEFVYHILSKEDKLKKGIGQNKTIDLVDSILFDAIKCNASDIHLEQTKESMRVRFRLDGLLYDQKNIEKKLSLSVASRIKILSSLDIAEKRIPQDGKFSVKIYISSTDKIIDMRVSTFPSIYGEKIVIRILNKDENSINLNNLGMNNTTLKLLYNIINRPYGFFLVTGPTGSGKTTTLYSILSYLNNSQRNIITMEDPVEYNLEGITQSQINEKSGFSFKKGLRSILRQDPDVVMIGEIRDKESAQIAIEAALTGHLVFSTLHTNDSIGAVNRLIEMGVEPFLISSSLSGVLAQRLSRRLCISCKIKDLIKIEEKKYLDKMFLRLKDNFKEIHRPTGCQKCFNLGYKKRIGVFELLKIDDELRNLINKKSVNKINNYARKNNFKFLIDDAFEKLINGTISFEEFIKISNFDF